MFDAMNIDTLRKIVETLDLQRVDTEVTLSKANEVKELINGINTAKENLDSKEFGTQEYANAAKEYNKQIQNFQDKGYTFNEDQAKFLNKEAGYENLISDMEKYSTAQTMMENLGTKDDLKNIKLIAPYIYDLYGDR